MVDEERVHSVSSDDYVSISEKISSYYMCFFFSIYYL